jgi:hypothetical protein
MDDASTSWPQDAAGIILPLRNLGGRFDLLAKRPGQRAYRGHSKQAPHAGAHRTIIKATYGLLPG